MIGNDPLRNPAFRAPGLGERLRELLLGERRPLDCVQVDVTSCCAGRCAPFLLFSMMSRLPKVLPARRMRKDGENCMFPHGAYAIVVYHIFGCQTSVHTGIGQIVCAHTVGVR